MSSNSSLVSSYADDDPDPAPPPALRRLIGKILSLLAIRPRPGPGDGDGVAIEADGESPAIVAKAARFGALRVVDVMVPRANIVAVREDIEIGALLAAFDEAGHSRLPVYREVLDDPLYMVHVKDLIKLLVGQARRKAADAKAPDPVDRGAEAGRPAPNPEAQNDARNDAHNGGRNGDGATSSPIEWTHVDLSQRLCDVDLRRPLLFVPPSMPAADLLERMQATRRHLAIVIDEYGGADGLTSIEDLVEEIVGDIEDEHDAPEDQHTVRGPDGKGRYEASARVEISAVEEKLGRRLLSDDQAEDIDTLGGLIFSILGRVPVRGEIVPHPSGLEFIIVDADPRRIRKVLIDGRTPPAAPPLRP